MATDWLLTANVNTFVKRHRSLFVLYLVALVGSSQACPCRTALLKPRDTSASPGEVEKILKSVGPPQTRQNPTLQVKPGTGIVSKALPQLILAHRLVNHCFRNPEDTLQVGSTFHWEPPGMMDFPFVSKVG